MNEPFPLFYEFGPYCVDAGKRLLLRAGEPVALARMGKDEDALAVLPSIPGPVLPELVEANTAFALLRLGRRADASLQLQRALRKYPNDPSGTLSGIEAILLAESEPLKAEALIEKVAKRKAVNPSHHAAYSPRAHGRRGWGVPRRPSGRCGRPPKPGSPAIRCSRAIPTWIRSARIRVSRCFSPTCKNSRPLCGRRCSARGERRTRSTERVPRNRREAAAAVRRSVKPPSFDDDRQTEAPFERHAARSASHLDAGQRVEAFGAGSRRSRTR
jgi:hypothetical protein